MHISQIFLLCATLFCVGVFVRSFVGTDITIFLGFASIAAIIVVMTKRKRVALSIVIGIGLFVFALMHTDRAFAAATAHTTYAGKQLEQTVPVIKNVQKRQNYQNIIVALRDDTRVLVRLSKHARVSRGDRVALSCTLQIPENRNDFDYRMFLAKEKIHYVCIKAHVRNVITDSGSVGGAIARARVKMENNVNAVIAQPGAALANGLLFGGDDRLSQDLQDDFARTGMTHIVAVSGYNVTVITHVVVLAAIFCGLWRKHALLVAFGAVVLFITMIGAPSSGVRAAIMGTLVLFALHNGRAGNAVGAIMCAAAVMLLFNPLLLRFDIGFQLSFLATAGLIFLYPLLSRFFMRNADAVGFWEILLLTLSAQIFVLPIILIHFKTISIVSLLANIAVLAIVPVTMFFAFVSAVSGFFSPPFAALSGWIASVLLSYEVFVITTLAELEFASIEFESVPVWIVIVYYAVLFGVIACMRRYVHKKEKT